MLYKVVLAVTLPYVAGFAASPGGGTPPTTEALVEVMLNDLATSFGQVSTEEKNTAANEILKGNPEIKALLTEMVSKQVGMENWRTTHPEQAASACKPCVHQESTRSFERFLSYESLPDAATIAEKVRLPMACVVGLCALHNLSRRLVSSPGPALGGEGMGPRAAIGVSALARLAKFL
eukprot:6190522-Pleurochrysis_carterae.AAC.3